MTRTRHFRRLLALLAGASLVACGSGDDSSGNPSSTSSTTTTSGSSSGGAGGSAGSSATSSSTSTTSGGAGGSSGAGTAGGAAGAGASTGSGGSAGSAGSGGSGGTGGSSGGDAGTAKFSFFATSLVAMRRLSGSQDGFGGDLRFGKADGLSGADEICRQIAETSMPGAGQKTWRAFLSVTKDSSGTPVNAIDRVGEGPWYDRKGRLLAMNKADLAQTRPRGADPAIINDFPNEDGVPNHAPDGTMQVDNHDFLTGASATGTLYNMDWGFTCHDWTSKVGSDGKPRVGHSWPRMGSGENWMSSLNEGGCAPGVNIAEMGGPREPTVGSGGGYGGIYCFALTP
jgi:hypothetical protein